MNDAIGNTTDSVNGTAAMAQDELNSLVEEFGGISFLHEDLLDPFFTIPVMKDAAYVSPEEHLFETLSRSEMAGVATMISLDAVKEVSGKMKKVRKCIRCNSFILFVFHKSRNL